MVESTLFVLALVAVGCAEPTPMIVCRVQVR